MITSCDVVSYENEKKIIWISLIIIVNIILQFHAYEDEIRVL